jgi:hypothetical protein
MRCVRPVPGMGAGRRAVGPAFAASAEQRESFRRARADPGTGVFPGPVATPLRPNRFLSPIPDEIAGYAPKS